jgi:hypothetical protein
LLIDRVSPVSIALLFGAFLFFAVPGFGLVFLVLAWCSTRSARPWFRWALRGVLFLHLVAVNVMLVGILASAHK